jgi:hypothetical protein
MLTSTRATVWSSLLEPLIARLSVTEDPAVGDAIATTGAVVSDGAVVVVLVDVVLVEVALIDGVAVASHTTLRGLQRPLPEGAAPTTATPAATIATLATAAASDDWAR